MIGSARQFRSEQRDGTVDYRCVVLLCAIGMEAKVLPIHCVAVPTDEECI